MDTHMPSYDDPPVNTTRESEEPQPAAPSQSLPPQPMILPGHQEEKEETFYFEQEQLDLVTPFVAPFQLSNAMPTVPERTQLSDQAATVPHSSATKASRKSRPSLTMIVTLTCVAVIVGLFVMNALAQATPPLQIHGNRPLQVARQSGTSSSKKNASEARCNPNICSGQKN